MNQIRTVELPVTADVVVIGGGVVGCSTAFNLGRLGAGTVVLLEQNEIASGATGKSGALVRAHYCNAEETALTLSSLETFRNWSEVVGFGDPGFVASGFLRVVYPDDEANLRFNVETQRSLGGNTFVVSPNEIREIEPAMRTDDLTCAAFEPDSGYADPNATAQAYAGAAAQLGVTLAQHTQVLSIRTDGNGVSNVDTNAGTISTRAVVLAAGAYARPLLGDLGFELGLTPVRSQVAVFRWPAEMAEAKQQRAVIDSTQSSWLRPEGKNCTLIGCETGLDRSADPADFNQGIEPEFVDHARNALAARYPVFQRAIMRGGWSGVFMQSPDGHPIIDQPESVPGLYLMAGDSGSSFKTAPAVGKCLAEWVTIGEPQQFDLTRFSMSRFADSMPWVDATGYRSSSATMTISR